MDKYLTPKTTPGKIVQILENMALLIIFTGFALCLYLLGAALLLAYETKALSWRNLLPLIPAALLALAMNPLMERIRFRHHARVIAKALAEADGKIPADEAEAVIGVRRAADTALQLVEKGYLRDVQLTQGFLCGAEVAANMAPAQEIKAIFKD